MLKMISNLSLHQSPSGLQWTDPKRSGGSFPGYWPKGQHNSTRQNGHQEKGHFEEMYKLHIWCPGKILLAKSQPSTTDSTELEKPSKAPHTKFATPALATRPYLTLQHTVKQVFPTKLCFIFNNHLFLQREEIINNDHMWLYLGDGKTRVLSE